MGERGGDSGLYPEHPQLGAARRCKYPSRNTPTDLQSARPVKTNHRRRNRVRGRNTSPGGPNCSRNVKADASATRRSVERHGIHRAMGGDEDFPFPTRSVEAADRWSHD